jgi:hypothetical protein
MLADPYVPLATRFADRYSAGFLQAIDRALAFKPEDRPQNVAAMRTLLGLDPVAPAREQHGARPAPMPVAPPAMPIAPEAPVTLAMDDVPATQPVPPVQAKKGKGRALLAAGAGAVVLAAGGIFAWLNRDAPAPPARPGANTTAESSAGSPASTAPDTPVPAAAAPAAPSPPAFSPAAALDAILAGASPARKVTVQVMNSRVMVGRDRVSFSVRASHPGYVYVYMVGTEGDFHLLFPNAIDKFNLIAPGGVLSLPHSNWGFAAAGPPGIDHFLVMVSDSKRDFRAAGLVETELFGDFPVARAAELQRAYTGTTPLFAGVPSCSRPACPEAYGAATFTIDEYAQ